MADDYDFWRYVFINWDQVPDLLKEMEDRRDAFRVETPFGDIVVLKRAKDYGFEELENA